MFADVTGSTRLYEALGDDKANRIIAKVLDTMAKITADCQGHVIKTIGDEIMCRFSSANNAVRAAIACQESVSGSVHGEGVAISIKIGLHFGPAILTEDGDIFGDVVNVSARMTGIAKADQIITTRETVSLLDSDLQDMSRQFDKTNVKGKLEQIVVYQIVWETGDDVTRIDIPAIRVEDKIKYLCLDFQGTQIRISSGDKRALVIGRGAQSDLLCTARLASRSHATLEFRRGKFSLTDHSSNGTFVTTDDGESIFLRRQELMLWGSGTIALGEDVAMLAPDKVIRYVCE